MWNGLFQLENLKVIYASTRSSKRQKKEPISDIDVVKDKLIGHEYKKETEITVPFEEGNVVYNFYSFVNQKIRHHILTFLDISRIKVSGQKVLTFPWIYHTRGFFSIDKIGTEMGQHYTASSVTVDDTYLYIVIESDKNFNDIEKEIRIGNIAIIRIGTTEDCVVLHESGHIDGILMHRKITAESPTPSNELKLLKSDAAIIPDMEKIKMYCTRNGSSVVTDAFQKSLITGIQSGTVTHYLQDDEKGGCVYISLCDPNNPTKQIFRTNHKYIYIHLLCVAEGQRDITGRQLLDAVLNFAIVNNVTDIYLSSILSLFNTFKWWNHKDRGGFSVVLEPLV